MDRLGKARQNASSRLIVAVDLATVTSAVALARKLRGLIQTVKIGSVLFTAYGPKIIERMQALRFRIMLDLKFFDIPSTVELSCRAAVRHGVSLLTVHAAGGIKVLEAAVRGVRLEARRMQRSRPLVLGVTILTSASDAPRRSVRSNVVKLARSALEAGCDGVVASALEAATLRERFGKRLKIVCPGIRSSAKRPLDDQRRVASPSQALNQGADFIIVGRPITQAYDPRSAANRILNEMIDRIPRP